MAIRRPVLCPCCGAQIKKNGYCSACDMPLSVISKAYNTSDYYYNIGYDKATARDLSGAIESLNMSLRYNKKNIMARNLLGLIYYEMGEIVMALSHWVMSVNYSQDNNIATRYLKELKQDPTRLDNVDQIARKFNMALNYVHSEDYDLGALQLKSILKENPHFVKGYLLLALVYIGTNHYEDARKTLRRVLKIDKANPVAIHYLREMGDSDENIIQMRMESVENDGLFDENQSDEVSLTVDGETEKGKARPIFKEVSAKKKPIVKTGAYGEMSLIRYSGMYVLLGMIFGVLILSFLLLPHQKKKINRENAQVIKSYSEELANKNTEIQALNSKIETLNELLALAESKDEGDNPLPDYSHIEHGMSVDDIQEMIDNE